MKWYEETLIGPFRQRLQVTEVLHHDRTQHQDVLIFENPIFGRVLSLDGALQTTERDEFVYHEMLAHVPILAHGRAQDVLVIGGGDGGCLEEVLKHDVQTATMVEIDRDVVDLCREFLPSIGAGALDDPRTRLIIADGAAFVAETDARFDVVIVDSTDPIGPGEVLFGEAFLAGCRRALKPGGVLVTQNGVPFVQADELRASHRYLSRLFADASFYVVAVPTYNGGHMALGWATDNADLRRAPVADIAARYKAAGIETRYYTPDIHTAAFALPGYIGALMG